MLSSFVGLFPCLGNSGVHRHHLVDRGEVCGDPALYLLRNLNIAPILTGTCDDSEMLAEICAVADSVALGNERCPVSRGRLYETECIL